MRNKSVATNIDDLHTLNTRGIHSHQQKLENSKQMITKNKNNIKVLLCNIRLNNTKA